MAEWRQGAHGLRGAGPIVGGLWQWGRLLGLWGVWLCCGGHRLPHACGDKKAASNPHAPPSLQTLPPTPPGAPRIEPRTLDAQAWCLCQAATGGWARLPPVQSQSISVCEQTQLHSWVQTQKIRKTGVQTKSLMHVHSSIICNGQKVETTQMSISRRMN